MGRTVVLTKPVLIDGGHMSETYLALVGGFFCIGMAFLALVAVIVLLVINQTRSRKMK
jgi:uncharacterized membrane protein